MSPKRKTLKLPRWRLTIAAAASLATVAGVVVAASPASRHRGADCRYCVDGNCTPNVQTYGYYQTHWRTWPKAGGADSAADADRDRVKLPTQIEPPPLQEDTDVVPRPSAKPSEEKGPGVKPTTGEDIISPRGDGQPKTPTTDKDDPFKDDPTSEESPENESKRSAPKEDDEPQTSIFSAPMSDDAENDAAQMEPTLAELPQDAEDSAESLEPTPEGDGALTDDLNLVADAVPSSFETEVRESLPRKTADPTSPQRVEPDQPLRLIDPSRSEGDEDSAEPLAKVAHESANEVAAEATKPPEGANPLRSGWGARRPSTAKSSREPQVTSTFRGADGGNPLRR